MESPGGRTKTGHIQFDKLIDRTYDETLALLEEARDYALFDRREDDRGRDKSEVMRITGEQLRLTSRLSGVMAWLMVRKAVAAGEMTAAQAEAGPCHLTDHEICMADGRAKDMEWPLRLSGLLNRSRDLYGRVAKMDRMATRLLTKVG